ncbi:MAG TPA: hypothetical protein VFV48_02965, partial [Pseudomonadales bacterium]|nr:hypothetical protein [Pseudomonadales bacterium]
SADLMTRNLDGRVEVACPIYDPRLQVFLRKVIELQWRDGSKARVLDATQKNQMRPTNKKRKRRSQIDTFALVARFSDEPHGSSA